MSNKIMNDSVTRGVRGGVGAVRSGDDARFQDLEPTDDGQSASNQKADGTPPLLYLVVFSRRRSRAWGRLIYSSKRV